MATTLRIETGDGNKGRSFSALVLARAYAPCASGQVVERGRHRPDLLLLATAHEEASAIVANVREGRKMRFHGDGFGSKGDPCEVLKSERFMVTTQKTDDGTLILLRHPSIFTYSPGMVTDRVGFVCLPPRARLEAEATRFDLESTRSHLDRCGFVPWSEELERAKTWGKHQSARLVAGIADPLFPTFAALLVAGVAQRVGYPILDDPRFWVQFAAALFEARLAHRSHCSNHNAEVAAYGEVGVETSGFYPGAAVSASATEIGDVLSRETMAFLRDKNHG